MTYPKVRRGSPSPEGHQSSCYLDQKLEFLHEDRKWPYVRGSLSVVLVICGF